MGLDTYARDVNGKLPEDAAAEFARSGIQLCGGMLSSNGDGGSFRGKVYANLVKAATGVDLYQESIDSETVEEMNYNLSLALRDLRELQKFFQVCVDYDLELKGWW
jgi:hypothetical protein